MSLTSRGLHSPQLALYRCLLRSQRRFEEFKSLLKRYPEGSRSLESPMAVFVRGEINRRIATWITAPFDGLTAREVCQWREVAVEGETQDELWGHSAVTFSHPHP